MDSHRHFPLWRVVVSLVVGLLVLGYSARFLPELERPVFGARISSAVISELRGEGLVGANERVLAVFSPDYPDVSRDVKGITSNGVFVRVFRDGKEDRGLRKWSQIYSIEVFDEGSRDDCAFCLSWRCLFGANTEVVLNRGTSTELVLMLSGGHASKPFTHALFTAWNAARGRALARGE